MYQLPDFPNDFIFADINAGIGYERAVARLQADTGKALHHMYSNGKRERQGDAEALREAYSQAIGAVRHLRPDDATGIAAILLR